jgi:outer membrane protein TolC
MKLIAIVLLFSIWIGAHAQIPMTSEDAIRIGLENNYDIQIARNNYQIAENNVGNGTAEFLPTLEASGAYQQAFSEQETNSPFGLGDSDSDTRSARIALNWTLFDGFKMFMNRSQLRALEIATDYQTRNIIENTVVSVLRAFFNVVQQQLLLDVAKNTVEISGTRFDKERVRKELGASSTTDYLNAQVAYNDDRANLMNQELSLMVAKKELNILLGRAPDIPFSVQKDILIAPLDQDIETLVDLALERNKEVKRAEQQIIVAQKGVGLARGSFFPRLSLNASYDLSDVTSTRSADTTSSRSFAIPDKINTETFTGNVGLTLSFNLFNGFRDKVAWQNARLAERNALLGLRKIQNSVVGLIREKYTTLNKRLELIQLEAQNVQAAAQNLQIQQDRYAIGAASSLEFRDAQVNLNRAQTVLITAQYQARITRLEIDQLSGILELK